jgi:adenosylmethionine-8-amino-7-oxononanoate aminotransferase
MTTYTPQEADQLKMAALQHLWIYQREPSEMAEKGGPPIFVEGEGCRVKDIEGNTYLDAMSGLWLKNVGYGRREIADAAYQQMLELTYMPAGSTTVPTVKLAEKLAEITPGDLSRCFFTSGGSESVETALKIARAYQRRVGESGRYRIISRRGSYHGATYGAMSLGGMPSAPRIDYEPLMPGAVHVPQPNPYRCEFGGETPEECATRCANAVEEVIKFYGPQTVAAVIAEPIASPPGVAVPGDNYWPLLRDICTRHGVLLIADEVITGFGRTGRMFACEHWGITPDIMTVAKGITSGYIPMGAAIARKEIADAFVGSEDASFRHIITFGGHPVAAAAALRNIQIMEDEELPQNADAVGSYLLDGLRELYGRHQMIGDVRGKGLMCGVEIVKDRETKQTFPADVKLGDRMTGLFRQHGLLLRGGDAMNIAPPLCATRDDADEIVTVMDEVFTTLEADLL